MEVIKKGGKQDSNGWYAHFQCCGNGGEGNWDGCGAILMVSQKDLYWPIIQGLYCKQSDYRTFCCSECGKETYVKVAYDPLGKRPKEEEIKKIIKKWEACKVIHGKTILQGHLL